MGMYTEIYVNVDLKKETPDEIIEVLKAMCDMEESNEKVLEPYPDMWIVSKTVGHSDIKHTAKYAGSLPDKIKDIYELWAVVIL